VCVKQTWIKKGTSFLPLWQFWHRLNSALCDYDTVPPQQRDATIAVTNVRNPPSTTLVKKVFCFVRKVAEVDASDSL